MSNKEQKTQKSAWPIDRLQELAKLERLLNEASRLNNSTNFVGNVQVVIELANELQKWSLNTGRKSFFQFLVEEVYKQQK